jgi:nucleoside-triphosphatase THEP1
MKYKKDILDRDRNHSDLSDLKACAMVKQAALVQRGQGSLWKRSGLPKSHPGIELERRITVQVLIDSPDSLLASFMSRDEPGRLILITGQRGSGKTDWCLALAEAASTLGIPTSGLVSPAVFEGDRKVGIDLRDLGSGVERRLAFLRGKSDKGQITQDWLIDEETLNWGNVILAQSGTCPLFILDELGPLELERGVGLTNGIGLISERRYNLACVVIRTSLLALALEYWPWGQILQLPLPTQAELEVP